MKTSFVTYMYKVVSCFIFAFQFWRTLCDFCFSAIVELNWLFVDRNKIHSGTKICYLGTYKIIPSFILIFAILLFFISILVRFLLSSQSVLVRFLLSSQSVLVQSSFGFSYLLNTS